MRAHLPLLAALAVGIGASPATAVRTVEVGRALGSEVLNVVSDAEVCLRSTLVTP